jgi:hypothetical protein
MFTRRSIGSQSRRPLVLPKEILSPLGSIRRRWFLLLRWITSGGGSCCCCSRRPPAERREKLSVGLQGSCILFCILTPNYDRLAHRRLFSLTRLLFSYLSLTRALFSLLRIHLRILGSLSLGNYRSRAP